MANSVTLAQLRTRARERADQVNSQFIPDSELLSYLNNSYAELYDLVVNLYDDYYVTQGSDTTLANSATITLPTDFYKLLGVDRYEGGTWVPMKPFAWNNRNQPAYLQADAARMRYGYRVLGNTLRIEPFDACAGTYRLWYIPSFTPLASANDLVDPLLARNGWDEYIVVDAAIKMMIKEESDPRDLRIEKANLLQRIQDSASDRDADQPIMIKDTRDDYGWGWWGAW